MDDERLAKANALRKKIVALKEAIDDAEKQQRRDFSDGYFTIVYKSGGKAGNDVMKFPVSRERGKKLVTLAIEDLKVEHAETQEEYYNL